MACRSEASLATGGPVLVLQNDLLNKSRLNTTVVAVITSNLNCAEFKGNVFLSKDDSGLSKDSVIVGCQIMTVDKHRFLERVSKVPADVIKKTLSAVLEILG